MPPQTYRSGRYFSKLRGGAISPLDFPTTARLIYAGDIQAGDVIVAVISRGATIEAKSAEQVNGIIAKLEKGASVTFLLRRGELQFFSTLRVASGE